MIALKTILVATDFEKAGDAALAYGRGLARALGGQLVLLNVAADLVAQAAASAGYAFDLERAQTDVAEAAQKALDARLTDEDRRSLNASGVVLVSRSPAWAILEYAHKIKADLLIVGTHGRGGLSHFFLGSVAERIVRSAPCPVLTVRHPEREFVIPDAFTGNRASLKGTRSVKSVRTGGLA